MVDVGYKIMSKTFSHASSRAPSLQDWAGRFVFIALFFGSVLLVAIGRFEDTSMGQVQQKVSWLRLVALLQAPLKQA